MTAQVRGRRGTATRRGAHRCPTCSSTPAEPAEIAAQRLDLEVEWFVLTGVHLDQLVVRRFCAQCQPRGTVYVLVCRVCGDGPMLVGPLAESALAGQLPEIVAKAVTARGWRPTRDRAGWVCCQ